MTYRKKYLIIAWFFVLSLLIYMIGGKVSEQTIQHLIAQEGASGPIIFILLILLANVVAPLSGSPIIIAGFYLFGAKVVWLANIAGIIAFIINFWIARRWGRPLIKQMARPNGMTRIDRLSREYGLLTLFFLRLLNGGLHDFVSYAFGLTSVRFLPYFIISLLGIIPSSLIWYYLASQSSNPLDFVKLTGIMVIVSVAIFFVFSRINRAKKKEDT